MKRRFLREPPPCTTALSTLTGDGIRMAMPVGAEVTNTNLSFQE